MLHSYHIILQASLGPVLIAWGFNPATECPNGGRAKKLKKEGSKGIGKGKVKKEETADEVLLAQLQPKKQQPVAIKTKMVCSIFFLFLLFFSFVARIDCSYFFFFHFFICFRMQTNWIALSSSSSSWQAMVSLRRLFEMALVESVNMRITRKNGWKRYGIRIIIPLLSPH